MATVESRAKVLGHAMHPMLIVVPLGMFVGPVVFDGVFYFGGREPQWAVVAYWMIVTGLIGGVVAAVPGWIDWFAIPSGTRAKRIGLVHGLGNGIGVLGLFGASWYFRRPNVPNPPDLALLLSLIGFLLGGVTAWLGGELIERLGVGVDPGAHPNAPNSLSGRSAGPLA
ncbi:DUF2231 domain-containing protein [Gemmata sp. JC717]|uniref:DUF2231 domain-containing protein n=1 Tax=Gemmata algarum TaxID=2975278 RepID=UPI0021BBB403|nr:DUF2231 domain-containing protein [Gemmata algarum]MDY3556818.1 DUF2231 domain-containing protein [Gemmata algarum]